MSDCGLTGLTFKRPSLVKPQFAEECDLKDIVKRFLKAGQLPATTSREEITGDATTLPGDFQTLMDQNVSIRQEFDLLPLDERNKYNNDPEAWAAELIAKADKKGGDDEKHSISKSGEELSEVPVKNGEERCPPVPTPPIDNPAV